VRSFGFPPALPSAAEKSAIAQERLKAAQKKASPVVDRQQKLAEMRDQAEAMGYVPLRK